MLRALSRWLSTFKSTDLIEILYKNNIHLMCVFNKVVLKKSKGDSIIELFLFSCHKCNTAGIPTVTDSA